jgi:uncharacterized protein YfkK (UPF0435 family)
LCEDDLSLKKYIEIFSYLKIDFRLVNNYANLHSFIQESHNKIYLLNTKIIENFEFEENQFNYFSFSIEKNKNYSFEEITKKLLKLNYSFSEYENP